MELQFNEYVKCKTNFGEVIAKFMMHRLDKPVTIVDYDNRLHQFPTADVKYATTEDLQAFIDDRLFEYNTVLEVAKRSVESFSKRIVELKPQIKTTSKQAKGLDKQRAAKGVMIRLMEANRQKGTEEYNKVSNEDFCLMEKENVTKNDLRKLEDELKKSEEAVKRGKDVIVGVQKAIYYWECKKENLLEKGIRNIDRGGH